MEKRIWRVIDTRDKFNRPFSYPVKGRSLVEIIMKLRTVILNYSKYLTKVL